jgi:hypothetical protein
MCTSVDRKVKSETVRFVVRVISLNDEKVITGSSINFLNARNKKMSHL